MILVLSSNLGKAGVLTLVFFFWHSVQATETLRRVSLAGIATSDFPPSLSFAGKSVREILFFDIADGRVDLKCTLCVKTSARLGYG